ncbi:sugar ABC transporter permease [Sphingomonas sp. AP4-R1]|uniref:carbohydrate ABC transporter permease n=1 Tax=Sphingomonas sp. AP4-R1 TaxID=2735134 RepID=UPI0014938878|nr:sugar ABC transporter permease [Sphingomonas sp. AP4-R1]QJU60269.1 sugar ABC transporter permease [Sphingomonas sp. AP4-R1]
MSTGVTSRRNGRVALILGAPALGGLLLFLALPFVMAFALTFTDQRLVSGDHTRFIGWRNYERLLGISYIAQKPVEDPVDSESSSPTFVRVRDVTRADPDYRGYRPFTQVRSGAYRITILARDPDFLHSLINTFEFAFLVVPLQCAVALGSALLVNAGLRAQTFFRAVYFSPVVMSMVVVSIVWTFLFHRDLGSINRLLAFLTFGAAGHIDWIGDRATAMPAIAVMSAWQGAGFQMLIFLAGLQGISQELYDAARIDGATAWQRFRHVTLPGLRQTIAFVLVVTTIAALGLFTQVDVMTQGGPQNATSTVMFHAIQRGVREENIAYGSTVAVVYFALITSLILLQQALQRRWSK